MAAEADERPKRRRYTTAERMKILEAVEEVGVVEAARGHGVPQTTVSNWLHRDGRTSSVIEQSDDFGVSTSGD
jgi:transposase-like protein